MLTIEAGQMKALETAARLAFFEQLADTVRSLFPAEVGRVVQASGEASYRKAIRDAVDRAAKFGLERESDVAVFVALGFANSQLRQPGKEFLGWSAPIMERADMAGPAKLALIEHRLRRQAATDPRAERVSRILVALRG
jgi:hypothetical protein